MFDSHSNKKDKIVLHILGCREIEVTTNENFQKICEEFLEINYSIFHGYISAYLN